MLQIPHPIKYPAPLIAGVYVIMGLGWIFFSDQLLVNLIPAAYQTQAQTLKGSVYVLLTGVLLCIAVHWFLERYRLQAKHFHMLFEHNPLPMWMCHPESLRILSANLAASQHYGYSQAEFLQLQLGDLEPNQPSHVQTAFAQGQAAPLLQHRTHQGQIRHVWLKYQQIDQALLIAAIDITRHAQAEAHLQQTNQLLTRQNQDLRQFTYIVSHNLRAPAANILGLLSIYNAQDSSDPLNPELIAKLQSSAQLLNHTLQDLNLILTARSNSTVQREKVVLKNLVETCLENQSYLLPSPASWTPHVDISEEIELFTIRGYLISILSNLISNAIKYRAVERPLELTLAAQRQHNNVEISVTDNGSGIDLARYGQKLFGFHQRFHPDIEGQGLGLYLVKTQVEILGGQIRADSTLGQGSCFWINLPLAPPAPPQERELLSRTP